MINEIFIDESKAGDWFVLAAVILRDSNLLQADKVFLRGLHATDVRRDRKLFRANTERIRELLRSHQAQLIYWAIDLRHTLRRADNSLWLTGIEELLWPFLPYLAQSQWRIVVERRGEFEDTQTPGQLKMAREDIQAAKKQAIAQLGKSHLEGAALLTLAQLKCLDPLISPEVRFNQQSQFPWVGAADFVANIIGKHLKRTGGNSKDLEQEFEQIPIIRVGV